MNDKEIRERIYVAGQRASDRHDDPVAKVVACAHASADEALLAVIDRAIKDGIDFYPALCRTREALAPSVDLSEASKDDRRGVAPE